jgi:hypothetical protein
MLSAADQGDTTHVRFPHNLGCMRRIPRHERKVPTNVEPNEPDPVEINGSSSGARRTASRYDFVSSCAAASRRRAWRTGSIRCMRPIKWILHIRGYVRPRANY